MSASDAESQIQAWGELYAFDLPKSLRHALWNCNLEASKSEMGKSTNAEADRISTPKNDPTSRKKNSQMVETSEEIWEDWRDDSRWHIRPSLFEQPCRFEIYRSILPLSSGRDSGAMFKRPLDELKKLQHHADPKRHKCEERIERTWTLVIIVKDKIALMNVQTDLGGLSKGSSIKARMESTREEEHRIDKIVPVGSSKITRTRVKENRKSRRGAERSVESDPKVKAVDDVLRAWSNEFSESELIFIRASRKDVSIHFREGSAAYRKLRPFPFSMGTGAPSIEELKHCFVKLTTAEIKVEV